MSIFPVPGEKLIGEPFKRDDGMVLAFYEVDFKLWRGIRVSMGEGDTETTFMVTRDTFAETGDDNKTAVIGLVRAIAATPREQLLSGMFDPIPASSDDFEL